jgi:hypothetical protein
MINYEQRSEIENLLPDFDSNLKPSTIQNDCGNRAMISEA